MRSEDETVTPRGPWGVVMDIRRSGGEAVSISGPYGEVNTIWRLRDEAMNIIWHRGEVTHIIGHRGEVTDIRRPGNIIRRLTWKCVSTWRLVYECSVHSQRCGGSA